MKTNLNTTPAPGWQGGFAQSNPEFAYPDPNLSSLDLLDNMDNIDLLQRNQPVKWPEFSWETIMGKPESRCYQMFAPYISRLGYTDEGRVYSIICPQQGATSAAVGTMNVEVTVTGQRGWVDEATKTMAADLTVQPKIWFSPSAHQNPLVKLLWLAFKNNGLPFPSEKKHAIKLNTYHYQQDPSQHVIPLRSGESTLFKSPAFARHESEAWDVANLQVVIGEVEKSGNWIVDDFNQMVMDLFNLASGNMLHKGNLLSWNVWFTAPEVVDRTEWREHAEKWRESIDADHGSPDGNASDARFFDGKKFSAAEGLIDEEIKKIIGFLKKHL